MSHFFPIQRSPVFGGPWRQRFVKKKVALIIWIKSNRAICVSIIFFNIIYTVFSQRFLSKAAIQVKFARMLQVYFKILHNYVCRYLISTIKVAYNLTLYSLFVFSNVKYLSPPPVSSPLRLFLINFPFSSISLTRRPIMQGQRPSGNPPLCTQSLQRAL